MREGAWLLFSPLWKSPLAGIKGAGGDSTLGFAHVHRVMEAALAGSARRRVTFFARAKKVTKENTPCFRRNPRPATSAEGGSQTRPGHAGAQTALAEGPLAAGHRPAAAEGGKSGGMRRVLCFAKVSLGHRAAHSGGLDFWVPLAPPSLGKGLGGFRRVCLSPGAAGASYAAAPALSPGEGTRRAATWGVLSLVTFFARAKKVTRRRAPPGL